MNPKNYAFIDSQNLNLSINNLGWTLDFKRFRIFLNDKYHIKKAFLFIGYIPGNEGLYTYLQKSGYIIIFKPTLTQNGIIKGNCDAELVLHCMIEYLINEKKLLKIGIPNKKKYSSLLRKFRNPYIFYINDLKNKVKLT